MTTDQMWIVVGFFGQALFSARFIVQWIYSEKHRRSIIPTRSGISRCPAAWCC